MSNMMNMVPALVMLSFAAVCPAQPLQPCEPDEHTLFLCHFDRSARADYAKGSTMPQGDGALVQEGRFGGGLYIPQSGRLSYRADDGNLDWEQGLVEFWLKPNWDGNDGETRVFFSASIAVNYLQINKLGEKHGPLNGKLGGAISAKAPDSDKSKYVPFRHDISQWRKGEWHHIALAWGGGEIRLYVDENQVALNTGVESPHLLPARFVLGSANCNAVIDEFRISDIPRYFGPFPAAKKKPQSKAQHFDQNGDLVVPTADGTDIIVPNPYRFEFDLPALAKGYVVVAKDWVSDVDPAAAPTVQKDGETSLCACATPGEYEPLSFVIYAKKQMKDVRIEVTDLKSEQGTIPSADVEVRYGMRGPRRRRSGFPAKDFVVVTTFLRKFDTLNLPANDFREIFLTTRVPDEARPGIYEGKIKILPKTFPLSEIELKLTVLPFALKNPAHKKYGMYYRLGERLVASDVADRELQDMKAHGVEALFPFLGIQYRALPSGEISTSYKRVEKGLSILRRNRFSGLLIVETGLGSLARLLGHDVGRGATGESLEKDAKFQRLAKEAIQGLKDVQKRYPEFEIVLTHMDEVFNEGRLPRYIRQTRAAQQVPGFRYYITFHTINEEADRMRKEIDPYVDIRCHHANYTFDWWLTRGHTLEEYAEELKQSGDEGAFYFNPVGAYCDAERYRVFNGLYMWLGPFKYHIPYVYDSVSGDSFNDLDGQRSEYLFAFFSEKEGDIIPAKVWEGYRQGIDDIKYLFTLESLIEEVKDRKPNEAKAARQWLEELRTKIPKPQGLHGDDRSKLGTPEEPPFINAIQETFADGRLQRMRYEAAQHILRLLE